MVDLLQHNKIAYEKIVEALENGTKKLAISHATGTGKSYLISKLFEKYEIDNKLLLVPSTYIKEQMKKIFEKYNIKNVDIMLYQKFIKINDEEICAMNYKIIALDEFHHDTSKVWGDKVKLLIESHPDSLIFGTTATPVRADGTNTLDALFDGNCVSELPLSVAIAKQIVPLPVYVSALYSLDEELEILREKIKNSTNSNDEKDEFYKKINSMREQIEKSYGMPIILNRHIKDKEGKYIVFCKNKKHLESIKETVIEWFKVAGFKNIHSYVVHSSYEGKNKEYKEFCEDSSHNLKLLFCVNMLNEGLHLKNISGVLLLRPTSSNIVWLQQIGRAIEANNTNTPVIIDAVNNFNSVQQGTGLLREIKEAVAKENDKRDRDNNNSCLMSIDTFFVTGYVQDIQDMFNQVEGRLKDSWDLWIKALKQYKAREGDCLVPKGYVEILEDGTKIRLGNWVNHMRQAKKGKGKSLLTSERIAQLNDLGFVWSIKQNQESRFDKFYRYVLLYKEKYGHVNIKSKDEIDGYRIGDIYSQLIKDCKKGKLTDDQVQRLKNIGVDITRGANEKQLQQKLELAKQALSEGVVITARDGKYKGIDLYNWKITNENKFTDEEKAILNQLIPNNHTRKVAIINIKNNEKATYPSIVEAGKALYNLHITDDNNQGMRVIYKRLRKRTKNPTYKGYRFEYVD
ncbi:MAG: DEAD/DEAH box helicase family protein [Lachnospira sp.]|jgi:superfamily II DNA or RNA helicase|nr:DEAD/DEAH box helicase family protein [Lachnospira sp.]